jgi:hypothetical protein
LHININKLFFLVSKTTKELLLEWDESHEKPVFVAEDLRMPQFEMMKITTNRCHETNHMGESKQPTTTMRILSFGGFDGCTQGGADEAKWLKSTFKIKNYYNYYML